MTHHENVSPDPTFVTGEGLRTLLIRLHEAGPGAWRRDPEAHELAHYVARKYARLARKYGLDRWEAVTIAFETMLKPATRRARDPWAIVTKAVGLRCYYESRAQGMLCSVDDAEEAPNTFHDAERFADREQALLLFHPSLASTPDNDDEERQELPGPVMQAVENAITVFVMLEWPVGIARDTIEYICQTLARMGNRPSAIEALRKDEHARALFDLRRKSWNAAIRVMLGTANPAYAATRTGRGLLMRLVLDEPFEQVFADDELVKRISSTAPNSGGS